MVSVLGVAAPLGALTIAVVADRLFHHAFVCREPAGYDKDIGLRPAAPLAQPPEDVFEAIQATCGGPEGVESCGPLDFAHNFANRLAEREDRTALERRWLTELANGDHVAAYGLAWLGSRRALPELRRRLLADGYFYGWETLSANEPEILYADGQYPHHQAMIAAIEHISGQPLRATVKLSPAERERLRAGAARCNTWQTEIWLLHRLDDTPLPDRRWNFRKRLSCED